MKNISVNELHEFLENDQVVLIDVREEFEYKAHNIPGAHLIPLASLNKSKLPVSDKPYVIHCKLGGRSAKACMQLLAEDPNLDVSSVDGGIIAWQDAGYKVNKLAKMPVVRQTQVTIGLIIVVGALLGHLYNYNFYLVPVFMGCGLIFAGISGFCGMAKLLARMPWNKD